jgi:pimeloyl-ACP methyl ester carboxylesterase
METKTRKISAPGKVVVAACLFSAIGLVPAFGQEGDVDGGPARGGVCAFTQISTTVDPSVTSPLKKVDTVVQVGGDPRNRFTMHRIDKPRGERRNHRGSIILLPSLVNSFHEYMIGDNHDPMQSLAATLALADYAVYGYSPRTANLPVDGCTSGAVDCSVMKDWGFNAYLSDIDYVRRRAAREQHEKPAIGGLSLGGMLGVAAVNANPAGYSGLLLWDAILYSADPTIIGLNNAVCAQVNDAITAGIYFEEALPKLLKQLAQMGEAGAVQFFGNPQPALGAPNFIQLVADEAHTQFQFASFPRVFDFVMAFNNVEALTVIRDAQCSFAGDRTFTANLRKFRAPVFAIQQGQGFGPYMRDTIDLMRSRRIRLQDDPAFGHLDAYLVSDHATYVEGPILDWLATDVFPNDDRGEDDDDERDD